VFDRLPDEAEGTNASFLARHPEERPAHRDRHEVDEDLIELGESAVVAPIANDPAWQDQLLISERLCENVLDRLESAVSLSTKETPALGSCLDETKRAFGIELRLLPSLSQLT
jgi:hypothetical protein